MNNVYFTSDMHLGHRNIIKYCHRPFLSDFDKSQLENDGFWRDGAWVGDANAVKRRISDEAVCLMDNTIIDNINRLISPDDTLWFLGDFCFAPQKMYYQAAKQYRDRIACKHVYLVMGNHDHESIGDLFENVYQQTEINVLGQRIVLNHYSMRAWNGSHRNTWQLYGHSHGGYFEADLASPILTLDVGVDTHNYEPWSFQQINEFFNNKKANLLPK